MLNKRNINSVCLSRKDLLSDKVSTKGPPDFENLTAQPFTTPLPVPMHMHTDNVYVHTPSMHTDSNMHTHTHTSTHAHTHAQKKTIQIPSQ